MLLAAERTLVDGRAVPGMGVSISPLGRVQAVGLLPSLGRPTHVWPGELLVPGLVDVFAPRLWQLASGDGPWGYTELTQAFRQRLSRGVTTVGIPHRPRGRFAQGGWRHPFAEADRILAAAQEVGLRVALLDTLALRPKGAMVPEPAEDRAPSLDGAIGAFEQLVRHIMSYQDSRMSWALYVPDAAQMPLDALMGLRVRLGHLPCLLAAGQSPGGAYVHALAQRHLLDASVAYLDVAGLDAVAAARLAAWGARHVQGPEALGAHLWQQAEACVPLPPAGPVSLDASWAAMTGEGDALTPLCLQPPRPPAGPLPQAAAQALLRAATEGGTKALGLRGGQLRSGHAADGFTVSLEDPALLAALPVGLPLEEALPVALARAGAHLRATRTIVGGVEVWTESA
jgi:hypothetical protein